MIQEALDRDQLDARIELGGLERDKLFLHYPALAQGTGYVAPVVTLESSPSPMQWRATALG